MSSIKPTIGRKVWFYSDTIHPGIYDYHLPFDATVVYIYPDGKVNLLVITHGGWSCIEREVKLRDPHEGDRQGSGKRFATWMPYQIGQATKEVVLDTDKLLAQEILRTIGIEQPNVETAAAMLEAREIAKARTRSVEQPTDDAAVEQQLQTLGKTAPRITPADIEANILEAHYFTAYEAVEEVRLARALDGTGPMDPPKPHPSLALFTICTLVLKNGFVVTGESACASPENFNAEIGQRLARAKAIDKVWPLMGYELRSKLAAQAEEAQPVSVGLTD